MPRRRPASLLRLIGLWLDEVNIATVAPVLSRDAGVESLSGVSYRACNWRFDETSLHRDSRLIVLTLFWHNNPGDKVGYWTLLIRTGSCASYTTSMRGNRAGTSAG